jgi:DNA-binding NtrC family response regulator
MDALAPALILLDLMMPGMTGLQFLDAVRASPSLAAIPVVIMSGLGTSFAGVERVKVAAIIRNRSRFPCSSTRSSASSGRPPDTRRRRHADRSVA